MLFVFFLGGLVGRREAGCLVFLLSIVLSLCIHMSVVTHYFGDGWGEALLCYLSTDFGVGT